MRAARAIQAADRPHPAPIIMDLPRLRAQVVLIDVTTGDEGGEIDAVTRERKSATGRTEMCYTPSGIGLPSDSRERQDNDVPWCASREDDRTR